MNIRRLPLRAAAFAAYLVVVGGMLALIFVQSVNASNDRRQLLEQVADLEQQSAEQVQLHRDANQSDHDCIVALALLLADPTRDRNSEIIPPRPCRAAPAAKESKGG